MTIRKTLLARGYFPKELPPAFFTDQYAAFATSAQGRRTLDAYKPHDNFTQCAVHQLAVPGLLQRELRIPHPYGFDQLTRLAAKSLKRLLKKAGVSSISRSRPVYAAGQHRAMHTSTRPPNLHREKANARAAARYLVKADVSHFYPALYTHAVGWAIDSKLRERAHWKNYKLLGKKIDQLLMDLQGKVSQGVPIGNDVSFLLAEVVLAQVDKELKLPGARAVRWYDDYEISCATRDEAERVLLRLRQELAKFQLRLNPHKTTIVELPQPVQPPWQEVLSKRGSERLSSANDMVQYFDRAFALREEYPETAVMVYALGILFVFVPRIHLSPLLRRAAFLKQSLRSRGQHRRPLPF